MKKNSYVTKIIVAVLVVALIAAVATGLVACVTPATPDAVTATLTADKATASLGDTVVLTLDDSKLPQGYQVTLMSTSAIVTFDQTLRTMTVVGNVEENTSVLVAAFISLPDGTSITANTTVIITPATAGPVGSPSVTITSDKDTLSYGDIAQLTVDVTNVDGEYSVILSANDTTYITINQEAKRVIASKAIAAESSVTIFATISVNNQVVCTAMLTLSLQPAQQEERKVIDATLSTDRINKNETARLNVYSVGLTDRSYTVSCDPDDVIDVDESTGIITVIGARTVDTAVTITVTSVEDPTIKDYVVLTVTKVVPVGSVGALTSEMLEYIGSANITVNGQLRDIYVDTKQSQNSKTNVYDMWVTMDDGMWSGAWWVSGRPEDALVDVYRRGDTIVVGEGGVRGYPLERLYINKYNQVAAAYEKNYISIPALWQNQHLWNHLSSLDINRFTYDDAMGAYYYPTDWDNEEQAYLMTYLSYCLTPMLDETLNDLYVYVETVNGVDTITKIVASTAVGYFGATYDQTGNVTAYDALAYSVVELTFNNIGTTVVKSPEPFDAPEHAELLTAALAKMAAARNYTFQAVEVMVNAPSADSEDYSSDYGWADAGEAGTGMPVGNNVSATGIVGMYGLVTEEAALFASTDKYSSSLDDKLYHTEYSGYKQDGEYYDKFQYEGAKDGKPARMKGTSRTMGSYFDLMPKFDFSASVFYFAGASTNADGVELYTFVLADASITREISTQVSCHKYASDGDGSVHTRVTIVVDGEGNLVSTKYPFAFAGGTYAGTVTTTYTNVGTTVLPDRLFDTYEPRVWPTTWSMMKCMYYYADLDAGMDVVINNMFGDAGSYIPQPNIFLEIFGDNIYGPFANDRDVVQPDGTTKTVEYFSINTIWTVHDENWQIDQETYMVIYNAMVEKLGEYGYVVSAVNTRIDGGTTGRQDRVVTFVRPDVDNSPVIVMTNNFTRNLSIYFYPAEYNWRLR